MTDLFIEENTEEGLPRTLTPSLLVSFNDLQGTLLFICSSYYNNVISVSLLCSDLRDHHWTAYQHILLPGAPASYSPGCATSVGRCQSWDSHHLPTSRFPQGECTHLTLPPQPPLPPYPAYLVTPPSFGSIGNVLLTLNCVLTVLE